MRRVKLHPNKPTAADPVFTRLMLDIQISEQVKHDARRGLLNDDPRAFADADKLEKGAWTSLAGYLTARGFADVDVE